jgi:hypothetical protein
MGLSQGTVQARNCRVWPAQRIDEIPDSHIGEFCDSLPIEEVNTVARRTL